MYVVGQNLVIRQYRYLTCICTNFDLTSSYRKCTSIYINFGSLASGRGFAFGIGLLLLVELSPQLVNTYNI